MDWVFTHLAIIVSLFFALTACILLLQQRRTPQSMVAWLLFVLIVPYLALPVFLVLGFRKHGRRFRPIIFSKTSKTVSKPNALDLAFQSMDIPPATIGNTLTLHHDPAAAWDALIDVVTHAKTDLSVSFYRISNDERGRAFIEALTQKVRDGVQVRLIIDRFGSIWRPRRALRAFQKEGGQLHPFSPLLGRRQPGHLNLRNHRKMVIADGSKVYAGGRNIALAYFAGSDADISWEDLCFTLSGPAAKTYCDVFESDWRIDGDNQRQSVRSPETTQTGQSVVQVVPSGPDLHQDPLHDGVVQAIHAAKDRVWIATPYFLPTEYLEHALKTAARRGLDVRILVPSKSNQFVADMARGGFLRTLEAAGAKICLFQTSMMHSKAGLIDGIGWLGSANFDVRSMLLNFETALFVYDEPTVEQLSQWFLTLETHCKHGVGKARLPRRLIEGLFRLGAPML